MALVLLKPAFACLSCTTLYKTAITFMGVTLMYTLPETGYLRLPQIIGDPKNNIPVISKMVSMV